MLNYIDIKTAPTNEIINRVVRKFKKNQIISHKDCNSFKQLKNNLVYYKSETNEIITDTHEYINDNGYIEVITAYFYPLIKNVEINDNWLLSTEFLYLLYSNVFFVIEMNETTRKTRSYIMIEDDDTGDIIYIDQNGYEIGNKNERIT